MKHSKYVKETSEISESEFYFRMHWMPSKKPKYEVGSIVKFLNSDMPDNPSTFQPSEWIGLIIGIHLQPPQDYAYSIRWMDLWQVCQRIDLREDMIIGKL